MATKDPATPLHDNVLILRDKLDEVSKGGIILPDSVKHKGKAMRGKVIACGPGKVGLSGAFEEVKLSVGDRVAFGAFSGHDVEVEGKMYVVVPYPELLVVLA